MIAHLLTFISGVIFALGLGISEMTRPVKILAFLDVLGNWDPSLLIVMAVGIGVYYPLQNWIRNTCTPMQASCYTLPKDQTVDRKLLVGAAIFGLGWGMLGLCPGPAVTIISTLKPELFLFLLAVGAGMLAAAKTA